MHGSKWGASDSHGDNNKEHTGFKIPHNWNNTFIFCDVIDVMIDCHVCLLLVCDVCDVIHVTHNVSMSQSSIQYRESIIREPTLSDKHAAEGDGGDEERAEPLESNGEPPIEKKEEDEGWRVAVLMRIKLFDKRSLSLVRTYRLDPEQSRTDMREHWTLRWTKKKRQMKASSQRSAFSKYNWKCNEWVLLEFCYNDKLCIFYTIIPFSRRR